MGYLFLGIALSAGLIKGYCGKKTSGLVTVFSDSLFVNIVRMVFCLLIGLGVFLASGAAGSFGSPAVIAISAVSGITTAVFVTTWLLSVRKGAYMLVEIFLMLGMLITIVTSFFAFHETVVPRQIIGILVLLAAIFFMCLYQRQSVGKLSLASWLLLLACGTANGLCDFSQKWLVKTAGETMIPLFQIYTYLFSFLALLLCWFFVRRGDARQADGEKRSWLPASFRPMLVYIVIMSVCLYLNSYFKTLAASILPAVILYPLNQGMGLFLSTLMSAVLFHEKPSRISILGILFAFVALFLMQQPA